MAWNRWNRQIHRWMSLLFTLIVIGIFATLGLGGQPAEWVYYLPLAPLFVLFLSGLWLFAQPYLTRWRGAGRNDR